MQIEWVTYFSIHSKAEIVAKTPLKCFALNYFVLEIINFLELSMLKLSDKLPRIFTP